MCVTGYQLIKDKRLEKDNVNVVIIIKHFTMMSSEKGTMKVSSYTTLNSGSNTVGF